MRTVRGLVLGVRQGGDPRPSFCPVGIGCLDSLCLNLRVVTEP